MRCLRCDLLRGPVDRLTQPDDRRVADRAPQRRQVVERGGGVDGAEGNGVLVGPLRHRPRRRLGICDGHAGEHDQRADRGREHPPAAIVRSRVHRQPFRCVDAEGRVPRRSAPRSIGSELARSRASHGGTRHRYIARSRLQIRRFRAGRRPPCAGDGPPGPPAVGLTARRDSYPGFRLRLHRRSGRVEEIHQPPDSPAPGPDSDAGPAGPLAVTWVGGAGSDRAVPGDSAHLESPSSLVFSLGDPAGPAESPP